MITGASAGVGRAVAVRFARQGAAIGLLARGRAGLEGARRDVEAAGGRALILPADVADPEAVERAAAQLEEAFGPIDVWVNNAMTPCTLGSWIVRMNSGRMRAGRQTRSASPAHSLNSLLLLRQTHASEQLHHR